MSPVWAALDWMQEHVPIVLVIWMVINASGLRDAYVLLTIGVRRRRIALSRGLSLDGPRVLVANRGIREMTLRTLFHATGLLIGIWVVLGLPPVETAGWLIVTMALVMAVASKFDVYDDNKLGEILKREIREHSILRRSFPLASKTTSKTSAESPSRAQEGM